MAEARGEAAREAAEERQQQEAVKAAVQAALEKHKREADERWRKLEEEVTERQMREHPWLCNRQEWSREREQMWQQQFTNGTLGLACASCHAVPCECIAAPDIEAQGKLQ